MAALAVLNPYPYFSDGDGPLDNGTLWFGVANQNPITAPVQVYWDEALTIPAAQPILVKDGYPWRLGTPAAVYIDGDHSTLVRNRRRATILYAATSAEYNLAQAAGQAALVILGQPDGASRIGFEAAGADAVPRTVESKLRDFVSVKDFGAIGDGAADDTVEIQAALNSGAGAVYFPSGTYRITATLTCVPRVSLYGDGGFASQITGFGCDLLSYVGFNNEGETSRVEDIGFVGGSGANFTAIISSATGGVKHGLHFNRLRFQNINAGIALESNLHCSITNCGFTAINQPVRLGNISTFTKVRDNVAVCQGGDSWGSSGTKRAIYVQGGANCEATKISGNFLYGFGRGVQLDTVTDVVINDNGIDACTEYGIIFQAVQHNFDIKDNFIELLGASAAAGICGLPVGSGEYLSKINIEGNSITELGGATVSTTGIVMNTTTDTFQWHVSIIRNIINGMKTHDIRLNLPGETFVRENRCMSTALAQSIWIGSVSKAPVIVEDNWCLGAIYNDVAADRSNGKLKIENNGVNNVWVPAEVFNQAWTPANASADAVTITVGSAGFTRLSNRVYVVNLDITWPVTALTGTARVSLPALPAAFFSGACGFTDFGGVLLWAATSSSATFTLYNAAGVLQTNANMSGKRITAVITFSVA